MYIKVGEISNFLLWEAILFDIIIGKKGRRIIMKKKIYNIIRNYLKKQLTGNLGKVIEKDDALYCYVDKKKCRPRRFFLNIMCQGIKRCDKELARIYNLDKKVYYIFNNINFKKNEVRLFGNENSEIIIKDCNFEYGLDIANGKNITLDNVSIKYIRGLNLYAENLNLKNMNFDNHYYYIGCKKEIRLYADACLSITDSNIGRINGNFKTSIVSSKLVLSNAKINGKEVFCDSKEIECLSDSSFIGANIVRVNTDSYPENLLIEAPNVIGNKEFIQGRNNYIYENSTEEERLGIKRQELITALKDLKNKCTNRKKQILDNYDKKLSNQEVKKLLKNK